MEQNHSRHGRQAPLHFSQNDDEVLIKEASYSYDELQEFGNCAGFDLSQSQNSSGNDLAPVQQQQQRRVLPRRQCYRRQRQPEQQQQQQQQQANNQSQSSSCNFSLLSSRLGTQQFTSQQQQRQQNIQEQSQNSSNPFASLEALLNKKEQQSDNDEDEEEQQEEENALDAERNYQNASNAENNQTQQHGDRVQREAGENRSETNCLTRTDFHPSGNKNDTITSNHMNNGIAVDCGRLPQETSDIRRNNPSLSDDDDDFVFPQPDFPTQQSEPEQNSKRVLEKSPSKHGQSLRESLLRSSSKRKRGRENLGTLETDKSAMKRSSETSKVLEKGRRVAASLQAKNLSAMDSSFINPSSVLKSKNHENIRFQAPRPKKVVVTRTAKSIVGTRPKHWCRNDFSRNNFGTKSRENRQMNKNQNRQKKLAAAVLQSTATFKPSTFSMPPPSNRHKSYEASSFGKFMAPQRILETPCRRPEGIENVRTFAPALLAKASSDSHTVATRSPRNTVGGVSAEDDLSILAEDDDESFFRRTNAIETTPALSPANSNSNYYAPDGQHQQGASAWPQQALTSPLPNRKTKRTSKMGPLAKRLKSIRDNIKGDSIRFQSGQYPFASHQRKSVLGGNLSKLLCRDRNDPRSRASSYLDVTMLGPGIPLDKQPSRLVGAPGFVHSYKQNNGSESCTEKETKKENVFVWITFLFETAREQNLKQGSELRIYNAVWIPKQHSHFADKNAEENPRWTVTCTQLCEQYPCHVLPPLPSVDDIRENTAFLQNTIATSS